MWFKKMETKFQILVKLRVIAIKIQKTKVRKIIPTFLDLHRKTERLKLLPTSRIRLKIMKKSTKNPKLVNWPKLEKKTLSLQFKIYNQASHLGPRSLLILVNLRQKRKCNFIRKFWRCKKKMVAIRKLKIFLKRAKLFINLQ